MSNKPSAKEIDRLYASIAGRVQVEEIRRVLEGGWDPNWVDRDGRSLLSNAVNSGIEAMVRAVIEWPNVDVNLADKRGYAPIHFAAMSNYPWAIRLLVQSGANIDSRDYLGNTPLFNAVYNYRNGSGGESIVELLRSGANVDAVNIRGITPRQLAFDIANTDVRRFFQPLPSQ